MRNRVQQRANARQDFASAKRKKDNLDKERAEYRENSMNLKRQQTNAIQQKNAIDFCRLLKDCGEHYKEEFDSLVKSTLNSIMKSHEAVNPEDSSQTRICTNDYASVSPNGNISPDSRLTGRSSSRRGMRIDTSIMEGTNVNDSSPASSSNTSIDTDYRRVSQMSQQRTRPINLDDESINENSTDDENNNSYSGVNILTQARNHEL